MVVISMQRVNGNGQMKNDRVKETLTYIVKKWKHFQNGMQRRKKIMADCPHCKIPMLVERRYYDDGDYHEFYVCDKCGADYG